MAKRSRYLRHGSTMLSVSIVVIVGFFCAREAPEPQTPTREKREAAAVSSHPGIGFASHDKFVEHFRKHGREFGSITMEAYLHLAQELRDRPAGGSILEEVRKDGVTTRFDRETGAFIAFNPDRTIRTFFRPNDGEAYFHRQSKRQQND